MGAATRASSAEAIAALDALRRPAAALGGELLAAARAIASSSQLASLLTDVGVEPAAKQRLITSAFAGLGVGTRGILKTVAAGRWSAEGDLVDTIEELGFRALARTAKEASLERELFAVQRAVSSDPQVELAVGSLAVPVAARLALVDGLVKRASQATGLIARHVVALPRGRRVVEGLARAERIVAEARGRTIAVAEVAKPLTAAQLDRLAAALSTKYGKPVTVNEVVVPDVVGGVRVRIGDEIIDGTVRSRLDDLKLKLAG